MSIFSSSSTATQTPNTNRGMLALFGLFAGISLLGATGCVAEVQAEPAYVTYSSGAYVRPVVVEEDVAYVETAPVVEIETYPSVYYGGRPCYWVDGRWYYRGPRGWAYYRTEPGALVTHRVEFERRYPHGYARVDAHVDVGAHARAVPAREARVEREYRPSHPVVRASGGARAGARVVVKSNHHH